MALDTHLCSPGVSERAGSERGVWLWWLRGARRLCSWLLARGSLGREAARTLTSFCHWLIGRPRVGGRKLEVRMRRHFGSETVRGLGCERPG